MKKKFVYKQLNIEKALKGKDEIFEEDIKDDSDSFKKISLFDFVNDIRKTKKGTLLEDESNNSIFNSFMILKALSAKEEDIILCNYLNKYTNILSKEQMYKALLLLIDKDYDFYKLSWKKDQEDDDIKFISKYFDCSKKEAFSYKQLFGQDWSDKIKNKYIMKEEQI